MREVEFGTRAKENGSLVTLSTQWRMRPDISNLIRVPLYPTLLDADAVMNYPNVRGKNPKKKKNRGSLKLNSFF